MVVALPVGTVIFDDQTNEMLADLITPWQRFVGAHRGRGGRGTAISLRRPIARQQNSKQARKAKSGRSDLS